MELAVIWENPKLSDKASGVQGHPARRGHVPPGAPCLAHSPALRASPSPPRGNLGRDLPGHLRGGRCHNILLSYPRYTF